MPPSIHFGTSKSRERRSLGARLNVEYSLQAIHHEGALHSLPRASSLQVALKADAAGENSSVVRGEEGEESEGEEEEAEVIGVR